MYSFSQIMIFFGGILVAFSLNMNNRFSKYGPVLGVIFQPFWFYTTYLDRAWGTFALSFVYLAFYIAGIYNFWLRKNKKGKTK